MKEELFPTPTDFDDQIPSSMKGLFHEAEEASRLTEDFDLAELDAILGDSLADISDMEDSDCDRLLSQTDTEAASAPAQEEQPTDAAIHKRGSRKAREEKTQKKGEHSSPLRGFIHFITRDKKTKALAACITVLAVLLCCVGGVLIGMALDPYNNRILENTTIGGIDVGGMTRLEAYRTLREATASTFTKQPMEVTLPDAAITLSPENTKAKLSVWSAVSAAFRHGREGTDAEKQAAIRAAEEDGYNVDMLSYIDLNQEYIRTQLEAYAAEHNVAHSELSYHLEGTQPELAEDLYSEAAPVQTLQLTLGTPLEELDVDAVLNTILDAYNYNRFQVTIESIEYQTTPAEPDLEAISQEFYIAPVNTTLDLETYQQIPGSYGYALDMEAAKALLAEAEYGETVSIPMTYVKPDILGDEAYFRDELGYCETRHTNNENRNTNLALACAALDGVILQPGEEFSYNNTVGERTAEKGYKPAPAYSGTRTVDSIGGGVCQVSTTLYNATLLADMEIVFRVNHGFRSGYIGVGLDATVSWGGPDFQFRNNSHFPVMIKAEVSDGFVKVWLFGTDEKDYYIKMTSGYDEDDNFVYSWSYKNKYDKETDELISKEREAYSCYMK